MAHKGSGLMVTATSVRTRVVVGMLLSAALVAPVVVLSLFYISQIDSALTRIVATDLELLRLGDRVAPTFLRARTAAEQPGPTGDTAGLSAARRSLDRIDSICAAGTALAAELKPRFEAIRSGTNEYRAALQPGLRPPDGLALRVEAAVAAQADSVIEYARASIVRNRERGRTLSTWGQRNIITVLLLIAVMLAVLIVGISGRIVQPLKRITNALTRAEGGDLNVRVGVRGRDEFEQLARQLNRVFARLREIDDRKAGRIQLLEHRFRLLTADIAEGVLVFDRAPNIIFANSAVEPLLGRPASEAQGHSLTELPHLEFLRDQLEDTLSGAASHQECGILPGLPFSAVCIEALRDKSGSVVAALVVITNPVPPVATPEDTPESAT